VVAVAGYDAGTFLAAVLLGINSQMSETGGIVGSIHADDAAIRSGFIQYLCFSDLIHIPLLPQ
jgi:hypothetical protein